MRANNRKPAPAKLKAEPPKRGRPPKVVTTIDGEVVRLHRQRHAQYDETIASDILERIAAGQTLSAICKEPNMPTAATVKRWVTDDVNGFENRYRRARDLQADSLFDETIELADAECIDMTEVKSAQLKIDTRFRYLAKLCPERFSDRVEITNRTEKRTDAELDTQILSLLETADRASLPPPARKLLGKPRG
jgi:hypothetical protein